VLPLGPTGLGEHHGPSLIAATPTGGSMGNRKGFTLIELLIVVVIIGILAAIAIPKFANTKDKAKIASMKSDLRNLVSAQEGHFADYQTYATGHSAT
jgi:prepilin-type N-terminal cleavage/methylation domain-containing protein